MIHWSRADTNHGGRKSGKGVHGLSSSMHGSVGRSFVLLLRVCNSNSNDLIISAAVQQSSDLLVSNEKSVSSMFLRIAARYKEVSSSPFSISLSLDQSLRAYKTPVRLRDALSEPLTLGGEIQAASQHQCTGRLSLQTPRVVEKPDQS